MLPWAVEFRPLGATKENPMLTDTRLPVVSADQTAEEDAA